MYADWPAGSAVGVYICLEMGSATWIICDSHNIPEIQYDKWILYHHLSPDLKNFWANVAKQMKWSRILFPPPKPCSWVGKLKQRGSRGSSTTAVSISCCLWASFEAFWGRWMPVVGCGWEENWSDTLKLTDQFWDWLCPWGNSSAAECPLWLLHSFVVIPVGFGRPVGHIK